MLQELLWRFILFHLILLQGLHTMLELFIAALILFYFTCADGLRL